MRHRAYGLAYNDGFHITEIIKRDYRAEKVARRGNVIWFLGKNEQYKLEVGAFLVTRRRGGWDAVSIQGWGNKYLTCPLSYIEAAEVVPDDPVYRLWVQALRDHYKDLGKQRKKHNRNRKRIQLGDIIKLSYRNLSQGMVISLEPLTVMYEQRKYRVAMKAFQGWIAHAREAPSGS